MKRILLFPLLFFAITIAHSQYLVNSGDLIQGGVEDGVKLISAYILPMNRAMMVGMNNTAFTRITYKDDNRHFNFSVRTSLVAIPEADRTFDVNNLNLQNMHPEDPNKTIAQTVFGDSLSQITLVSNKTTYDTTYNPYPTIEKKPLFKIKTLDGSGYHAMPLPYMNAAYRFKYTNFSLGFIPWITVPKSDVRLVLYSLSVHQNLAWFIKGLQDKPLAITLLGGYYHFYAHTDLDVQPNDNVSFNASLNNEAHGPYDNQEIKINYNSMFLSAAVSYTLKSFTFYGLAGYNTGTSHIQVLGNYPVYVADKTGAASITLEDITDPMDETDTYSRIKYTAGFQFDFLGMFYAQANYTFANYGGLGAAIGFRF